jgi:hypothetical protein
MHLILPTAYFLALGYLILKCKVFNLDGIPKYWVLAGFALKCLAGFSLTWVYTYYYTDRSTADIYKYFDDAKVMVSAIEKNPIDFLKMMFGIANDNAYFDHAYYDKMNHWYRHYSAYYNDNHTIIRFNALVMLFSCEIFAVHTLVICFLSTLGLVGIYRFFMDENKSSNRIFFILLFISPSLLFWGSGVLKEGLVIFGLGLLVWHIKKLIQQPPTFWNLAITFFSVVILAATKYYVLACILPGILGMWIGKIYFQKYLNHILIFCYVVAIFVFFCIGKIVPNISPPEDLAHKQRDFINLAKGGAYLELSDKSTTNFWQTDTIYIPPKEYKHLRKTPNGYDISEIKSIQCYAKGRFSGAVAINYEARNTKVRMLLDNGITQSQIEIPKLDGGFLSYLKALPVALTNAIFQPLWPAKNPFYALAFLENMLYLALFGFSFIRVIKNPPKSVSANVLFSFLFSICLLSIIGLTTPVIGALVRYKVPALPFLLGIICSNFPSKFKLERFRKKCKEISTNSHYQIRTKS